MVRLVRHGRTIHNQRIILLDLYPFELPENGSNQLGGVSGELEVKARVTSEGKAVNAIQMLGGVQEGRLNLRLSITFERQLVSLPFTFK